jgi:hypothetical protein
VAPAKLTDKDPPTVDNFRTSKSLTTPPMPFAQAPTM